ncbi:MAG: hypothetical protein ACYTG6_11505 [Planctomycetota bacterium]|jgi:hypothetical protein
MAKGNDKKPGDAVKSYTLVMTLLVVVMAVLYFVLDGARSRYAEANTRLERDMTGRGLPRSIDGPPRALPDLAYAVEQLARTYSDASGGGGLDRGIPAEMMRTVATSAGLRQVYASGERNEPGRNWETIHQKFEYEAFAGGNPEIWRLLTLLYNIESRGRYRASEVRWQMADPADDAQAPFDLIKKPNIQVSLRGPKRRL